MECLHHDFESYSNKIREGFTQTSVQVGNAQDNLPLLLKIAGTGKGKARKPFRLAGVARLNEGVQWQARSRLPLDTECLNCDGALAYQELRPNRDASRRGAQYDGDPDWGTGSLLWETVVP
jgi:hypothetical protein